MLSALLFLEMLTYILLSGNYSSPSVPTYEDANTSRRRDMARVLSSFTEYRANNNGKVPTTQRDVDLFVTRYIDIDSTNTETTSCGSDQFCDPDGKPYHLSTPTVLSSDMGNALAGHTFATDGHTIHYYQSARCGDEEGSLIYEEPTYSIAIMYIFDDNSIYCGDNY